MNIDLYKCILLNTSGEVKKEIEELQTLLHMYIYILIHTYTHT
jgi:hypothetical protein